MIEIAVIADTQMIYEMWLIEQKSAINVNFTRVRLPRDVLGRQFNSYIILHPDEESSTIRPVLMDYLKASLFQANIEPIHYTLLQRIRRAYANFRKV